ncbi:uncharacterized protein LOC116663006 isoform X2 [Camelus ferus]|nr:uncharacterized protein LOC116663006 isoform X2 [Camelus ferus]
MAAAPAAAARAPRLSAGRSSTGCRAAATCHLGEDSRGFEWCRRRRPRSAKRLAAACVHNPEIVIVFAPLASVFRGRLWFSTFRGCSPAQAV